MTHEPMERFEETFEAWAARPPERSADEAAAQLLERLATREIGRSSSRAGRPAWARPTVAAAVGLATWVALWFLPGDPADRPELLAPSSSSPAAFQPETPPLPDDVVVMWIDRETPLYLTMTPPEAPRGGPPT